MVLSLHTDSPLSDLRCCLCFQLSLLFLFYLSFVLTSLYHALALRPYHRFSSFCSLRLYAFSTALLSFSPPVQSCSPRCLIPYTVVQPSDVSRDTFTLSFSFSLSLPLFSFFLRFFSNLYSFLPLRSFLLVHSSLPLPFFHTLLSSEPAVFLMISLARVYPLFPSFLDSSLFLYLSLSSLRLVSLRSARISLDRKHHVIHDFLQFVIFSPIFLIISVQQLSS